MTDTLKQCWCGYHFEPKRNELECRWCWIVGVHLDRWLQARPSHVRDAELAITKAKREKKWER